VSETITLWHWQVRNPSGHWRRLAWRMTEDAAAQWAKTHDEELRKVPGSAETRTPEDRAGGLMTNLGTMK
jgi:hypothetical protein